MKNVTKTLGMAASLFLFALVFMAPAAKAQYHLTDLQVMQEASAYSQMNRLIPDYLAEALIQGGGVTIYSTGGWTLDYSPENYHPGPAQVETYELVMISTSDPTLAIEAALGLLTPAELEEALYGGRYSNGSLGGRQYFDLAWFSSISPFRSYTNEGGGPPDGGDLLN